MTKTKKGVARREGRVKGSKKSSKEAKLLQKREKGTGRTITGRKASLETKSLAKKPRIVRKAITPARVPLKKARKRSAKTTAKTVSSAKRRVQGRAAAHLNKPLTAAQKREQANARRREARARVKREADKLARERKARAKKRAVRRQEDTRLREKVRAVEIVRHQRRPKKRDKREVEREIKRRKKDVRAEVKERFEKTKPAALPKGKSLSSVSDSQLKALAVARARKQLDVTIQKAKKLLPKTQKRRRKFRFDNGAAGYHVDVAILLEVREDTLEEIYYQIDRASLKLPGGLPIWLCTMFFTAMGDEIVGSPKLPERKQVTDQAFQTLGVESTGVWRSRMGMMHEVRNILDDLTSPRYRNTIVYCHHAVVRNYRVGSKP